MKRPGVNICFFFLLLLLSAVHGQEEAAAKGIDSEKLKFHLNYLRMNVATLEFQFEKRTPEKKAVALTIEAQSSRAVNSLFYVNNCYELILNEANFLPRFVRKTINQKNVDYLRIQRFDHQQGKVAVDDTFQYDVPEPCYDYFSMLYFLRFGVADTSSMVNFYLDGEFVISHVKAVFSRDTREIEVSGGKFTATEVKLEFSSYRKEKRPWKTDLLTNRLTKSGSEVLIFLSADARRLPLKIIYRNSWTRTTMELVDY